MSTIEIGNIQIAQGAPLFLMAGPCVIESEEHAMMMAKELKAVAEEVGVPFIFKSSYDKANRSSIGAFRGPGCDKGLAILRRIKEEVDVPVISDVHCCEEVPKAAQVLDILQIPAFLCRQTDLLIEVGRTGKPIMVKKGEFLAPWDMSNVLEKIRSTGNERIIACERGYMFGYNNLVTDFRSIPLMKEMGVPVVFDATHSVQLPGGQGTSSGGQRKFVETLARAAVAAGCDGMFLETHDDPDKALCDGPNSLSLKDLSRLLSTLKQIGEIVKS